MDLDLKTFVAVSIIKIVITIFVLLTAVAYIVWLERKLVGHIQNRWGPTRVGPFGLLQPLADVSLRPCFRSSWRSPPSP